MSEGFHADVGIVGYGPTGLTAALTLARQGASVVVFEREPDIYQRARAVTINDWTMRIFQGLGVAEQVDHVVEPQRANRWVTYEGRELFRVEHAPSTLGRASKFYNIYQPALESTLRSCADEHKDTLEVRLGARVTDVRQDAQGVTLVAGDATGEPSATRVRYAVAADGGSSGVRKILGIAMSGDTVDGTWIVIDCRVKRWWPDRHLLTFWSDRERPVVDIALSAGNHRWEFPLRPDETPSDYTCDRQVWPLLRALGISSDDVEIHQYAFYQHHTRMADRWREGRIFLAGDAAHLMPPWAGAGMQSGIRDAHNLGWKLGRVLTGELDVGWLDTYETERRPNVTYYTDLSVRLGQIIRQEDVELSRPRSVGDGAPIMTTGWLSGPIGTDSAVGRMVPQPVVSTSHGTLARLDDVLGDAFVLLGDDVDPRTLLDERQRGQWDALGARYIAVRSPHGYAEGTEEIVDVDGLLAQWLRRYGATVAVVRPDRFVAATDRGGLDVPPTVTAPSPGDI